VVPQRVAGGGSPALDTLQVRAARAASGRLSLSIGGHETAARLLRALPERRMLLPLPTGKGPPEVRLEAEP
jgi:hypothetical protein